ncbi:hypothetical protein HMPREF1624_05236 [Sporothrix schenckii ATCC 58251]|uniref:DNA replication regulator Sld3 C-terminal domain-containing protein n=1 Tax=Sporothrix schenckii (strain ATCC 58251 / de Perez 2211183) TaxID=1391915 RepID=U7PS96_SPOS1|nr:hypothetical protein HMPREF1624_05236 [Sporothrix schenckii ATCC 58251]
MSSQHGRSSSHAVPRPTTSNSQRPSSQRIERPLSSSGTVHGASPASASRKRPSEHGVPRDAKRRRQDAGVLSADELLKPSIVVRAHPSNPLSRPCTLFPMMLLPREHLPLSYLDLTSPSGNLPSSRHFQSDIRILDLEGRLGSNILIARSPSSNSSSSGGFSSASSIFAIEREEAGIYVLCKLGNWVDVTQLGQHATAVCQQRMPSPAKALGVGKAEEPASITPQVYKERGRKRLAIAELQSIVRRRPASQVVADAAVPASQDEELPLPLLETAEDPKPIPEIPRENKEAHDDLPARPPSQALLQKKSAPLKTAPLPTPPASDTTKRSSAEPTPTVGAELNVPPTAEDIFQNIRNQYFEALYHSLGSLAYFAKGPLSRARAAFHLDCDSNLEMDELIDFLKSIILTSAMIDKKYRETIPDLVSHLRTLEELSDHGDSKRKSKKPKKVKLGSSGLYTGEDVHVRKWWAANKPAPRDDEVFPRPEEVKYTISCLRTRETQLQMILILEIMALETMRPTGDAGESQLPGMVGEMPAVAPIKKEAPKKRNKHNLPLLIDVHADRLCIWQSTTSDEVIALAESQARPVREAATTKTAHSDPLKDFCVDIILPFFSPRLPLVCDTLNRKLGGPVISAPGSRSKMAPNSAKSPSDAKSREKSSSSKSHQRSKPGSAARRSSASTDKTRSLERVLSSERLRRSVSRGPNDAIAQMRSATAAPIPGLKREMSEPALASIPRRSSSTSLKERPSNALSRTSSDVVSASVGRSEETRARKKAMVDAELQEAISALKKPNRELAGKATVEAAEKRLFESKKQISRPSPGGVQVKATPVNNRFRDVFATTTAMEFHGNERGHVEMHGSYSQRQLEYPLPSDRELLFPGRSVPQVGFLPVSPRVMGTPMAGRVQATPMRTSTSVPDSAARAAPTTSAPFDTASITTTTTTSTTTATMSKFSMARTSRLESFPKEEDSMPISSPVAARRVASQVVRSGTGAGLPAFRKLGENKAALFDGDMIPASSPLQARSQPAKTMMAETENRETLLSTGTQRRSTLFETPTKVRLVTMEDSAAMKRVMATPLLATPLMATPHHGRSLAAPTTFVGDGNSVQSLYAQMGWEDEIDDLA